MTGIEPAYSAWEGFYRPALEDRDAARPNVKALVARADVVKAKGEDMRWLDSRRQLAARWLAPRSGDRRRHFANEVGAAGITGVHPCSEIHATRR